MLPHAPVLFLDRNTALPSLVSFLQLIVRSSYDLCTWAEPGVVRVHWPLSFTSVQGMFVIIFPSQTVVTAMAWVLEPVMEAQPKRGIMQSKTNKNFMNALFNNVVGRAPAQIAMNSTFSNLFCVVIANIGAG